jgi:hypothetical protein
MFYYIMVKSNTEYSLFGPDLSDRRSTGDLWSLCTSEVMSDEYSDEANNHIHPPKYRSSKVTNLIRAVDEQRLRLCTKVNDILLSDSDSHSASESEESITDLYVIIIIKKNSTKFSLFSFCSFTH